MREGSYGFVLVIGKYRVSFDFVVFFRWELLLIFSYRDMDLDVNVIVRNNCIVIEVLIENFYMV